MVSDVDGRTKSNPTNQRGLPRHATQRHDVFMRMPWDKSKVGQLDLVDDASAEPGLSLDLPALPTKRRSSDLQRCTSRTLARRSRCRRHRLCSCLSTAIEEDSGNPRTEFPDAELDELAEDIRQHGILQPIVVHPADDAGRYRIHFGAKRLRAARRAGLQEVPVVVRVAADPYAQVAENQKRHGLSPSNWRASCAGATRATPTRRSPSGSA